MERRKILTDEDLKVVGSIDTVQDLWLDDNLTTVVSTTWPIERPGRSSESVDFDFASLKEIKPSTPGTPKSKM
jgi:hypothetical protein